MRYLSLIFLCLAGTSASGCFSNWTLAGDPSAFVEFGNKGQGSEEISPIANALYTGDHPIRVAINARDYYTSGGVTRPGIGPNVEMTVSMINLDTDQYWGGNGWAPPGVIVEMLQSQLMACGDSTWYGTLYRSCEMDLTPAQLGRCRVKVEAQAQSRDGGPVAVAEREFRVDVDGEPIFGVQQVLPNPTNGVARIEGMAASGLRSGRVYLIDRGTGSLLDPVQLDRDIQDALVWDIGAARVLDFQSEPVLFLQDVGPDDEAWQFDLGNDRRGSGHYGVAYTYFYIDLYNHPESDTLRLDTGVDIRVSEIAPTVAFTYDLGINAHSAVDVSSSDDRGVELIELSLRNPSSDLSWHSENAEWVPGEHWNRVYLFEGGRLAERDVTQSFHDRFVWLDAGQDNYELAVRATDFTGAQNTEIAKVHPLAHAQGSAP